MEGWFGEEFEVLFRVSDARYFVYGGLCWGRVYGGEMGNGEVGSGRCIRV